MSRSIRVRLAPAVSDLLKGRKLVRTIGTGPLVTKSGSGWSAVDAKLPDYTSRGIIVAIHGGVEGQPANPVGLTYDVRAIDASYLGVLSGLTPKFREVYQNEVQVYPAPVGFPCWLHRFPTINSDEWFLAVTEAVCYDDCGGGQERSRTATSQIVEP